MILYFEANYFINSKEISFSPPVVMELKLKNASPVILQFTVPSVRSDQNSGVFPEFLKTISSETVVEL